MEEDIVPIDLSENRKMEGKNGRRNICKPQNDKPFRGRQKLQVTKFTFPLRKEEIYTFYTVCQRCKKCTKTAFG